MIAMILLLAAADEPNALTVVFTSNRHAQVAPCHCDSAPLGGVDRQVGAVADLRAKNKNVLVLDGGDNFFDTAEQTRMPDAQARAELIADALDQIKPDLMIPGERDFLKGGPALRELGLRSHAPWVVSNVIQTSDRVPMFRPFLLAKPGDQRVLVLAVYSKTTFPKALADEKYELQDPVDALNRMVAMYKSYADLVIVVAHTDGATEEKIASKVSGISVILNAHEGRLQFGARAMGKVQSVAAGNSGKYLVSFDLRYRGAAPLFEAGLDVQKSLRQAATQPAKWKHPFADKNTLFFQLLPLAMSVPSVEALRDRAKYIDPLGYQLGAK